MELTEMAQQPKQQQIAESLLHRCCTCGLYWPCSEAEETRKGGCPQWRPVLSEVTR